MLTKSKKIEKNDQATHREAIQAALQALEKSENPNVCTTAQKFGVEETILRHTIKKNS